MFKDKLKELREEHSYSMETLADLYNKKYGGKLNKSTISRYENGLQEPLFTTVRNLADLFQVSVDELIEGKPKTVDRPHGIYFEPVGDLSKTIKWFMTFRHASKTDLVNLTGISLSRIDNILSSSKASEQEISALANAFDITEYMLLNSFLPDDRATKYIQSIGMNITSEDYRVLELFKKLDSEDKAEIRGEIKQMLKAEKYTGQSNVSEKVSDIDTIIEEIMREPRERMIAKKKRPRSTIIKDTTPKMTWFLLTW